MRGRRFLRCGLPWPGTGLEQVRGPYYIPGGTLVLLVARNWWESCLIRHIRPTGRLQATLDPFQGRGVPVAYLLEASNKCLILWQCAREGGLR